MKKLSIIALLLFVCTQISAAQETVGFTFPNATNHLEDYRLSNWKYNRFFLDLDGSFSSVNQFNDAKNRTTYGRINPNYMYYRESEELIIDGRAQLPIRLDGVKSETANGIESTISEVRVNLTASGEGKFYFQEKVFAIGQTGLDFNTFRRTTDGDNQPKIFRRDADSRFQVGAGAGYGRVRNVTPVIRALRFNERLNALDAGNLNDGQIQDLASVFSQRMGYKKIYDRPDKYFWNEIGNVAPDLFNNMNFYDAYYLSESLRETTGQRYQGWDAAGLFFIDHRRFSQEQEIDGTNTFDDDESITEYGLNFRGRYFCNLSLKQMISLRANLGFGVATYSDFDDSDNLFLGGLEAGHLYNLTDRFLVQSAISYNYEKIGTDDYSISDRVLRINSIFTYFIEDNVTASANISYRSDKRDFGDGDQSRSDFGFGVSIRYFFLRNATMNF